MKEPTTTIIEKARRITREFDAVSRPLTPNSIYAYGAGYRCAASTVELLLSYVRPGLYEQNLRTAFNQGYSAAIQACPSAIVPTTDVIPESESASPVRFHEDELCAETKERLGCPGSIR